MTIGTHWIWHLLIGLVTYLVMRGLILSLAADDGRPIQTEPATHP